VTARLTRRTSPLRSTVSEDGGFGLIETVIALSLLAVVILGTTWALIGTLSAATVAKQRDVATGLAQGAIAAALAIPYPDLSEGLNPSVDALSGDSNITTGASVTVCGQQTSYTLKSTGAPIFASNSKSSEAPIVPHVQSTTEDGVAYKVATYPTANTTNPATANCNLVELVSVVSWTTAQGAAEQLVDQTTVASP
jgi:type II secretory pathway pseudopilin PulG